MKTIIAGSRTITDFELLEQAIETCGFEISTVISGCAKGLDRLGEFWAEKYEIPILKFPADWVKYGRGAGPVRNKEMAKNADACIVLWDGKSKGAKNMIDLARKNNLLLYVYDIS